MSDREHAEEILETARRDLRALRAMNDAESFPDEIFGFHAQQSVETSLKAWLASLGRRFPKTHDLKQLIDLLGESGIATSGMDQFVELNAFAVQYRYESLYVDEESLDRSGLTD
jgi:HEPN domain-containing protein